MSCNLTDTHPILGSTYIALGTIYLIPYIPCIIVMLQNKLYKMSCYKIMIFMAILDLLNLFSAAFLAGYYSIIGRSYCPGDKFMTTVGAVALGTVTCCVTIIDGFGISRPKRIIWYTEQFRFGMHWTEAYL